VRYLQNVRTVFGANPASYEMGTGALSQGQSFRIVTLTTFSLVLSLRMTGAIHLLPSYAFMAWTDTTLPLHSAVLFAAKLPVSGTPQRSLSVPVCFETPHPTGGTKEVLEHPHPSAGRHSGESIVTLLSAVNGSL
jgi:hypothetical protein